MVKQTCLHVHAIREENNIRQFCNPALFRAFLQGGGVRQTEGDANQPLKQNQAAGREVGGLVDGGWADGTGGMPYCETARSGSRHGHT